jgi:hypothetical protein
MYNLTKLTCLLFLLLSVLACSKETRRETSGEGEPIYIYPVKTLEDYLYNVDQLGQRRNADGFESPKIPNLQPIPKLDSLIFDALIADSTSFESIRPPYYYQYEYESSGLYLLPGSGHCGRYLPQVPPRRPGKTEEFAGKCDVV